MRDLKTKKIIILTEIHTPYRMPVFQELLRSQDWELQFAVLATRQRNRSWNLEKFDDVWRKTITLSGFEAFRLGAFSSYLNFNTSKFLRSIRPDCVVISGYAQLAFWQARSFCIESSIPYITVTESHLKKDRGHIWQRVRQPVLESFYREAAAHLVMGSAAREYVRSFGVVDSKIFEFPNTIRVEDFSKNVSDLRNRRPEIRKKFGMGDGTAILYVGQLYAWKGVDLLLDAFLDLHESHPSVTLHFVGDGALAQKLRSRAASLPSVHFHGFIETSRLPELYAAADLFVLPSRHETWGVVLLEAMAAQLPVVVSNAVGATPDLVFEGQNGLLFDVRKPKALSAALADALSNQAKWSKWGQDGLEIAKSWSTNRAIAGFHRAIREALL